MRKEYVEYIKDLPISIHLVNIKEYPLHWRDSIQIIFVLKGAISVSIENEVYTLEKKEIEIINSNEVYSFASQDEDNLVLILNIDPNFFERYYDGAKEVFFYTNSSDDNIQSDEKYHELRKYISILLYEAVSKIDDYEDKIEENLLEMMYHLLNNFHYLYYEGEGLEDDDLQLERYHRIEKYLSNNYMNKVSLQEIADKEFLSSQYLSYKIKNVFGHGFNDYLNQIRVEESTKLLLDSDKNITEISEEVGFSHVRYYNKHFKLHYKSTPMQYRKKHKKSPEELEKLTSIKYLDIKKAIPYLTYYIEDYERYNYDNRIIKIDLDLDDEPIDKYEKPNLIDLGDISLLLEEENRRLLEEIQREIGFKYCLVNKLFSDDMDIYRGRNHKFINWTRVETILEFITKLKLIPIISTKNIEKHILNDFIDNFSSIYDEVEDWIEYDIEDLKPYFPKERLRPLHDTMHMAPYILYNYIHLDNRLILKMIDEIHRDIELNNDTFFGDIGIFTSNYLKKPSYYALMLLSLLGEEIISKGEGYIMTKSDLGYQILLYNPIEIDEDIIYEDKMLDKLKERKISLNLFNTVNDFEITRYDLNKDFGSVYDKWTHLGSPERIDNEQWELLKEYVHPNITFYYGYKSTVLNLLATVKPNGAVLYLLNKVQS